MDHQPNSFKKPTFCKPKGYAFHLSLKMDTVQINSTIYKVISEKVQSGPSGGYIGVIDFDPTRKRFYLPVYLNNYYLVARNG